jgi:flagellar biosynthesis chaperone FliJ
MPPGKRKKDPEIKLLRDALENLLDLAEDYRHRLEGELETARSEKEPYMALLRSLESQIESLRQMEATLDDQVWPQIIRLGHGSSYVEHTRTRDFF